MDENILKVLPINISNILRSLECTNKVTEIRIRNGQNIYIRIGKEEKTIPETVDENTLLGIIKNISDNSIYAVQNDINSGFLTIKGGHRVGIVGEVVLLDGKIKNIKYISSINIRVARQLFNIADNVIPHILNKNILKNTVIISEPGCGKTTLLRDIVRKLSYIGFNIGLVDERGEIASMYHGKYTLDVGPRTDVISYSKKQSGIEMLIRSMAPDIIATDEIGEESDVAAIKKAYTCGVKYIFTMHGKNIEDVKKNASLREMFDEGFFECAIVLSNRNSIGTIEGIYNFEELCKKEKNIFVFEEVI